MGGGITVGSYPEANENNSVLQGQTDELAGFTPDAGPNYMMMNSSSNHHNDNRRGGYN